MNGQLVLVVPLLRLHALEPEVGGREEHQQPVGVRQRLLPDDVVPGVVPVLAPGVDLPRVPEVGQREELVGPRLEDVEDHEQPGVLHVRDDAVVVVAPPVVDEPRPAVVEFRQRQEVHLAGPDRPVGTGVAQELEQGLGRDGLLGAVAHVALALAHEDLLGPDDEAVVEVVLAVRAEGAARHVVAVPAVPQQHRPARHQQDDAVLVGVAVRHLLFLDRDRVAQVVAEVHAAVALVAVVQQEVRRRGLPAVAEDDLLALDVFHHLAAEVLSARPAGCRPGPSGSCRAGSRPAPRCSASRSR